MMKPSLESGGQNPIFCRAKCKYDHETVSKAFLMSSDTRHVGIRLVLAAWINYAALRTLSEAWRKGIKPT